MNKKRVLRLKYRGNCYVLVSFPRRSIEDTQGEFRVESAVSFLYVNEEYGTAAEWEPCHGPIQVFHRAVEGDEGAVEHYAFDYVDGCGHNWSQIAVDREQLPQAAARGDWDWIFHVLGKWSCR